MTSISIVSTDSNFIRLLELEICRLGFSCHTAEKPMNGADLILLDTDIEKDIPLPRSVPVVIFSRREANKLSPTLVKRASAVFSVPFDLMEFRQAITQTLLRHAAPAGLPKKPRRNGKLQLVLEPENLTVSVNGGEFIKLSPTEYKLLELLNKNRGRPIDAPQAAGILTPGESNKFNVYICYLRRKLEKGNFRIIRTVRGRGYCIDA